MVKRVTVSIPNLPITYLYTVFFSIMLLFHCLLPLIFIHRLTAASWWRPANGVRNTRKLGTTKTSLKRGICIITYSEESPNSFLRYQDFILSKGKNSFINMLYMLMFAIIIFKNRLENWLGLIYYIRFPFPFKLFGFLLVYYLYALSPFSWPQSNWNMCHRNCWNVRIWSWLFPGRTNQGNPSHKSRTSAPLSTSSHPNKDPGNSQSQVSFLASSFKKLTLLYSGFSNCSLFMNLSFENVSLRFFR